MKYINHSGLGIILFPKSLSHKRIADILGGNITSAGFVALDCKSIDCYGGSESLHINYDPFDTKLLRIMAEL